MTEPLKVLFFHKLYGKDDKWMYNEDITCKYRFYVTDNLENVRTLVSGNSYTVKQALKFEDGFCSYIPAIKIGDFYIGVMSTDDTRQVRWHLKMVNNGWEVIPRKYYDMEVEVQ